MSKDNLEYNPNEKWYSISAIEDHDKCPRRRWFKKTCKLPVQQSTPSIFGDVAHACCERFFLADDQGRGVSGLPVNLYPDNWMTMKSRFAKEGDPVYSISPEEGALVQTLISKAISEGYLVRQPGRRVEFEFEPLVHKEGVRQIRLIGFIDLYNQNEVLDHKFVKNMTYAMSTRVGTKRDIRKSTQMMSYAMIKYIDGYQGNIDLTLIYYVKDFDAPQVNRRSVTVSELEVRQFFNDYTLPSMKSMLNLDFKYPKEKVMEWLQVPGANDCNDCNYHYGKTCPFLMVCTGHTSIQKYLSAYGILIEEHINSKGNKMETVPVPAAQPTGLMATIEASNAAVAGSIPVPVTPVAPAVNPLAALTAPVAPVVPVPPATASPVAVAPIAPVPVTPVAPVAPAVTPIVAAPVTPVAAPAPPVVETPAAPAVAQQTAPWYYDDGGKGCQLCKDSPVRGYNANRTACNVCDARNQQFGIPASFNYKATPAVDGTLIFTMADGSAVGSVQAVAEVAVKTTVVETPAPVPAPITPAVAPIAPVTIPVPAAPVARAVTPVYPADVATLAPPSMTPSPAPAPAAATPSTGCLTLMIGCSFVRNGVTDPNLIVHADNLMKMVNADIEQTEGKAAELVDHFKVIDYVQASAKHYGIQLREANGTIIAWPATKGSPMDKLIEGLRTIADIVVAPMGS